MTTEQNINAIELLTKFVNQRAGLCFADYGDIRAYRAESREITKDRADYYELLALANNRYSEYINGKYESLLNDALVKELTNTTGRLTLKGNKLEYVTGQYFPTEYRPAANRILVNLIWTSYRDEKKADGSTVYADGNAIRKAIKRNLSRRVYNNYFN